MSSQTAGSSPHVPAHDVWGAWNPKLGLCLQAFLGDGEQETESPTHNPQNHEANQSWLLNAARCVPSTAQASEQLAQRHEEDLRQLLCDVASLTQQLAQERQRCLDLQPDERIRANQAHSQHARIQADFNSESERCFQAQLQDHTQALQEMHAHATQDLQLRIKELTDNLEQERKDECIRANQAQSQHSRIQADLKAECKRLLEDQGEAQAEQYSHAMAELYKETEQDVQERTKKLSEQLEQQSTDHALQVEDMYDERRELLDAADQKETSMERQHRLELEDRDRRLRDAWDMAHSQTHDRNRFESQAAQLHEQNHKLNLNALKAESEREGFRQRCELLIKEKIQLVNERHELKCKIAEFTGRPVLEGQEHLYDVEQYIQGEEPFCPKVEDYVNSPRFCAPVEPIPATADAYLDSPETAIPTANTPVVTSGVQAAEENIFAGQEHNVVNNSSETYDMTRHASAGSSAEANIAGNADDSSANEGPDNEEHADGGYDNEEYDSDGNYYDEGANNGDYEEDDEEGDLDEAAAEPPAAVTDLGHLVPRLALPMLPSPATAATDAQAPVHQININVSQAMASAEATESQQPANSAHIRAVSVESGTITAGQADGTEGLQQSADSPASAAVTDMQHADEPAQHTTSSAANDCHEPENYHSSTPGQALQGVHEEAEGSYSCKAEEVEEEYCEEEEWQEDSAFTEWAYEHAEASTPQHEYNESDHLRAAARPQFDSSAAHLGSRQGHGRNASEMTAAANRQQARDLQGDANAVAGSHEPFDPPAADRQVMNQSGDTNAAAAAADSFGSEGATPAGHHEAEDLLLQDAAITDTSSAAAETLPSTDSQQAWDQPLGDTASHAQSLANKDIPPADLQQAMGLRHDAHADVSTAADANADGIIHTHSHVDAIVEMNYQVYNPFSDEAFFDEPRGTYLDLLQMYQHVQAELIACAQQNAGLQARLAQVSSQHSRVWQDLLSMHMLAYDFIFPRAPTLAGNIRRTQSPNTGLQLELSHPHVLGHRLFNIMDVDSDGVIGWRDLCEFTVAHIRTGSLDWRALWDNMTGKPHDGQMLRVEEEGRLVNWQAGQCWGMLTEAFAPDSNSPDWKGVNFEQFYWNGLGHDVGTLLSSPFDMLYRDAHAERCISRGAHLIKWGLVHESGKSDLDITAELTTPC